MTKDQFILNERRLQTKLMNQYRQKVYDALQSQIAHVISMIRSNGISYAKSRYNEHLLNDEIGKVIMSLYITAAKQALTKFQIKAGVKPEASMGTNEGLINDVIAYFKRFLLNKVVLPISQTTTKFIDQVLQNAIENGWGVEQTVSELADSDITKQRARMIVRTEAVRSINFSKLVAAEDQDFEVEKQWVAIHDLRTRESHREVDGEVQNLDEPFTNGLLYPGDENGDAEEVINCFLPDQICKTDIRLLRKCFRSIYDGEVITIQTANGKKFTCTPNHPILTTDGWIAAKCLTEQSYLLKSSVINSYIVDFNIENSKTSFEEIFNSLSYFLNSMRISRAVVNFHGDIPASNVDVISPMSHLHDRIHSDFFHKIKYFLFPNTNFGKILFFHSGAFSMRFYKKRCRQISDSFISFCDEFFSILKRGLFHSGKHRFALVSMSDAISFKSMVDSTSVNTNMSSNCFNAETVIEHLANKNLIHTNSERVIDITTHKYFGLVYNFSTDSQMYDINGFVAHNCRCGLVFNYKRTTSGQLIEKKETGLNLASKLNLAMIGK